MDINAIQDTLLAWVKSVTALPARWENKPTGLQLKLPATVVLTGPINIEPVGEDYVQWSDAGAGLVQPTVWGHREFDVMVRVVSRSQDGNKSAQYWLEKIRAALRRPSTTATLDEGGFAVLTMSKGIQFDAPFEERWESVASASLRCTAVISDADDAPESTLTSVELSSRIKGDDGTDLPTPPNLSDDLITAE